MVEKRRTGVIIIGRKISSYRAAGEALPNGHTVHKCAICNAAMVVSPEGGARMESTAAAMAKAGADVQLAITMCGECALKATLPANSQIIPTGRATEQLATSPEARAYLAQLEKRKKES